jgi:hypothetical protein
VDTQSLIQALKGFATGGLQGAGVPLPSWLASNPVQRAVQNPDNMAAMGMAIPNAAALAQALKAGKSYADIAKEFGTTRSAVAGKVRDWGLKGQTANTRTGAPPGGPQNFTNPTVSTPKIQLTPRDPDYTTNIPDWFIEEMKQ